ncbi:MAG: NAD(P)-binding domain-containing protein [Bacteroidetes bacterium]|nr:NAD(P)-binding domain-containing protein [Bacteroidota bacterium]MCH8524798.1 NAD(P)-binding domain-containing protein [Balneolales bacterium]
MENQAKTTTIAIIGCGWLGTPLAEFFIRKGYRVKGTTTTPSKRKELIDKGIGASVYRLGESSAHPPEADVYIVNIPPSRIDHYADKLRGLLAAIPGEARQIIYCSTTSVYGNTEGIVTESAILPGAEIPDGEHDEAPHGTPRSELLRAEGLFAADPRCVILRLAGLIGGGRNPARFLAGRSGVSKPLAPVNITHLDELIAVIAELVSREHTGEVLNVCADEHPTRKAYYTEAAIEAGLTPPVFDENDQSGGKLVDASTIESLTGLKLTRIKA